MAAGIGPPLSAMWKPGGGRLTYQQRLDRLATLPESKWTDGDRAVALIESSQLAAVKALLAAARKGNANAAGKLLEMSGLYTPGLKITGEIDHQHEHRVLQVNVRELSAAEFAALQEQNSPQRSLEAATGDSELESQSGAEAAAEAVSTPYSAS